MRPFIAFTLAALAIAAGVSGCSSAQSKEVHVAVTENGFEPKDVKLKGDGTVLVITRKTDRTCATEAIFVETGRKYDLPLDQPVRVDLAGVTPGTLHFACAMDMIKGTVTVEQ